MSSSDISKPQRRFLPSVRKMSLSFAQWHVFWTEHATIVFKICFGECFLFGSVRCGNHNTRNDLDGETLRRMTACLPIDVRQKSSSFQIYCDIYFRWKVQLQGLTHESNVSDSLHAFHLKVRHKTAYWIASSGQAFPEKRKLVFGLVTRNSVDSDPFRISGQIRYSVHFAIGLSMQQLTFHSLSFIGIGHREMKLWLHWKQVLDGSFCSLEAQWPRKCVFGMGVMKWSGRRTSTANHLLNTQQRMLI